MLSTYSYLVKEQRWPEKRKILKVLGKSCHSLDRLFSMKMFFIAFTLLLGPKE